MYASGLGDEGASEYTTILQGYHLLDTGYRNLVEQYRTAKILSHTTFILPTAPYNDEAMTRAWYTPSSSPTSEGELDSLDSYQPALKAIDDWIEEEHSRGIPHGNIIVAGFSQGAACSLLYAITRQVRLGGVAAMMGYLPMRSQIEGLVQAKEKRTNNLFIANGSTDMLIRLTTAEKSVEVLERLGFDVIFLPFPELGHVLNGLTIMALGRFIGDSVA